MNPLRGKLSKLERARNQVGQINIIFKEDFAFSVSLPNGKTKDYSPTPTFKRFHASQSDFRYIQGPFGSGKSSGCMAEIILATQHLPAWNNGIKTGRAIFIRNTVPELESTTLRTWLDWYGHLGQVSSRKKPIMIFTHRFNYFNEVTNDYGRVELEVQFMAFEREADLRHLDSLEATWAYVNELRHSPKGLLPRLRGRLDRFPPPISGEYKSFMIADSNPPSTRHWIYDVFEKTSAEDRGGWEMFSQPPGLIKDENDKWIDNPHHDTAQKDKNGNPFVKSNYYSNMAAGGNVNEEFIKVYCLGQYGTVKDGKPVYHEYNDDLHSVEQIDAIPGLDLMMGWDFGLTPAAVLFQQTATGQIRILHEFVTQRMGIKQLVEEVVLPYLNSYYYGYKVVYSVGDPAGGAGSPIDSTQTCLMELEKLGISTMPALSNDPIRRIESVKYFLRRLIDGKPAMLLSRIGCPVLREGFLGGYNFRKINVIEKEKYTDKPDKNEWSHIQDAFQYAAMGLVPNIEEKKSSFDISEFFNPIQVY